MIIDNLLTFSNPTITTSASGGTVYRTTTIDLSAVTGGRDVREGYDLLIHTTLTAVFPAGGAAGSLVVARLKQATAPITTAGAVAAPTGDLFLADLGQWAVRVSASAGASTIVPFPAAVVSNLALPGTRHSRYLYIEYTVSEAASTALSGANAGLLTTSIVLDAQDGVTFHASGFTSGSNPTV